ncbi:MAG: CPBP family intramembrane metalloprotease [Leptolyngbya sp. SIOISBB]|nr:CPBP family intramembrane metalloprotease [Leptolyngbya sp. SIOISBB]
MSATAPVSNYELAQAAPFNQVETYPITALPSAATYRPVGNWVGRLILPSVEDYAADPGDWAWFEAWHTPANPELLGQQIKVAWQDSPGLQAYVDAVTRDVVFSDRAKKFWEGGTIVPIRLDGRQNVGPLQSLAGARPKDDVTVRLVGRPLLETENGQPVVRLGLEPVQVTGREYGLVQIVEPDTSVDQPLPEACPGASPCPTEYFKVRHFNTATKDFTGPAETIRIPQQPMLKGDRFFSNILDLADAPAGSAGWYVYGARDTEGVFTVRSLQPRKLLQLTPDEVILGDKAGTNYIDRGNWSNPRERKGQIQKVLLSHAQNQDAAVNAWQVGDYGLVIHLFGGIGGENKEFTPAGTVTGHFAYGLAEVIEEQIAQEPQFQIDYQQIYTHNGGAIIAGTHDWASYSGDMQRGWLGQRPISDIVIKLDYFVEDLQLGDTTLSLFKELLIQAQIIAARYRTGDGAGVTAISPATSCVQDSNQALYIATEEIRIKAEQDPNLAAYVAANPDDPEVQKIDQFAALATDLRQALAPYGVVRPDWQSNAETLAGVDARGNELATRSGLLAGIFSWRSMMPRWGQDDIALIFLKNGADLWFLRPNQIGGFDPTIEPIPPTALFGLIPGVSRVALRLARSFAVPISGAVIGYTVLALLAIAAVAVFYGRQSGFLTARFSVDNPIKAVLNLIKLFFIPSLLEELIFRVGLLPHPTEGIPTPRWLAWAALSIGLFVLYHVVFSWLRPKAGAVLSDRRFLLIVFWIGIVLTTLYGLTGSMFAVTVVHWVVVVCWLYGFDGLTQLQGKIPDAAVNG